MVFSDADDLERDDHPPSPPGKVVPMPSRSVPDWLTGPADGLGAAADPDDESTDEAPRDTLPQPVLKRPGGGSFVPLPDRVQSIEPAAPPAVVVQPDPPEPPEPPRPPRRARPPGVWAPAASSVPVPRIDLVAEPPDDAPAPPRSGPAQVPVVPVRDAAAPHLSIVPPPSAAPLREPFWIIALDTLRTSRLVQATAAAALVAVVVLSWWMWPRGVGTTPLSEVRRYPSRFDGRAVTVRGRVGDDVFTVGTGWAFYLMQGRDTIVTFTRSQSPRPHEVITVRGQVSTGFLDGVPRQALFEEANTAQ